MKALYSYEEKFHMGIDVCIPGGDSTGMIVGCTDTGAGWVEAVRSARKTPVSPIVITGIQSVFEKHLPEVSMETIRLMRKTEFVIINKGGNNDKR